MNKDILEDEVEFPDDIISFLKVKYPKAHTDQEKAVLKQIEQLSEEKKELKDIISKKREQEKFKSLPIDIIPSEEAKEKAIKLVQDGTLQLTSKTKTIDLDDAQTESHKNSTTSQKQKYKSSDENKKHDPNSSRSLSSSKISFVPAGFAFTEGNTKSTDESFDNNLKRSISTSSDNVAKKSRQVSTHGSSESDEEDKPQQDRSDHRSNNCSVLRFCGHNMKEDFVRRIVEPYGNIVSLDLEERHDNTSNVIVTLDNAEVARITKEALDSQFIEGRIVNVYFKRGSGEFSIRRPFRRRRFRDLGRGRGRFGFPRNNDAFSPVEPENVLPSHFYSTGSVDMDDSASRKVRWTLSDETDVNEAVDKPGNLASISKSNSERIVIQYDDLQPI